jgi:NAD(P)-dependent dehydrogenase (short-subunit alcohol dehydrogenase family)
VVALTGLIRERFGGLDVFVNNSVSRPMQGYRGPLEQFAESMRVNATGMFDITREMTDLLIERGGGSVVHISSMFGMFGPDLSNYDGTTMGEPPPDYFFHNAGLLALARYQTRVLGKHNIRANCICPGGLYAPEIQPEPFLRNYTKKVPCGQRLANPDDIKGVVVFLASQASAYISGEAILMDGGMHC